MPEDAHDPQADLLVHYRLTQRVLSVVVAQQQELSERLAAVERELEIAVSGLADSGTGATE